jgi:hypothetical protein
VGNRGMRNYFVKNVVNNVDAGDAVTGAALT